MTKLLSLVIAVTVAAASALADERIVGRWDSESRTKGAIGNMYFFSADGAVALTVGAMIDFEYGVHDGELRIRREGRTVQATRFSIDGDTLVRSGPKGGARHEARRMGAAKPGAAPIVGRWRSSHPSGGDAFEEFTPDGALRFRVPFATFSGSYRIDGSWLHLKVPNKPRSYAGIFRIDGDTLVVRWGQSSQAERLKRVDARPIIVSRQDLERYLRDRQDRK